MVLTVDQFATNGFAKRQHIKNSAQGLAYGEPQIIVNSSRNNSSTSDKSSF